MYVIVFRVSQFLVSLLPGWPAVSEKSVSLNADTLSDASRASPVSSSSSSELFDTSGSSVVFRIRLRNVLLHVILRLVTNSPSSTASLSPHVGTTINAQSVPSVCIVTDLVGCQEWRVKNLT